MPLVINNKKAVKIAVIPDCQVKPGVNLDHLAWAGDYLYDKKPDYIVQIGDFADLPSLSSYDIGKKCYEGRTYHADIDSVQAGLSLFNTYLKDQYQIKQIVQDMLMRKLFGTNNFCYLEIMKIEYAEQLIAIENLRHDQSF